MARADEFARGIKDRSSDRDASFSQPFAGFRQRHRQHRGMIKLKHDLDYIKGAIFGCPVLPKCTPNICGRNALSRHPTTDTFIKIATLTARILLGLLLLAMGLDGPY
jgi:hypothetical protein